MVVGSRRGEGQGQAALDPALEPDVETPPEPRTFARC